MSNSLNKVCLIGRLGQDPKISATKSGLAVCNFSLATSEKYTDKTGTKQENTEWHRIVVFDKKAEICEKYLKKGKLIYIEGKLQTRQWENKKYPEIKHHTTEIICSNIIFLDSSKSESNDNNYEIPDYYDSTGNTNNSMPIDEDIPF